MTTQYFDPIAHTELLKLLEYNPQTGLFTWLKTLSNRAVAGRLAGVGTPVRYGAIRINGVKYPAHKLAIYWYSGIYPFEDVDHRDGRRDNNSIENLRAAGSLINSQNMRSASKNNKVGLLGVAFDPRTGRFRAQILAKGIKYHLGRFATPEEAHAAYLQAKRKYHEGCTI
jgi:hypothetical protein